MAVSRGDLLRYGLWAGLLATANANRRHFGLASTWVFHASLETVALLLPELYGGLARLLRLDERAAHTTSAPLAPVHGTLRQVVCDNPRYAAYVAPLVIGYLVSHPKFNIYKGDLAALRLAGFGLDSIPHATTACALSTLIFDTLDALACHTPAGTPLAGPVRWAQARGTLLSGIVLALVTLIYETGEWIIHNSELRATGGDTSKINMEWSLPDTLTDACSNMAGWLLAVAVRRAQRERSTEY